MKYFVKIIENFFRNFGKISDLSVEALEKLQDKFELIQKSF